MLTKTNYSVYCFLFDCRHVLLFVLAAASFAQACSVSTETPTNEGSKQDGFGGFKGTADEFIKKFASCTAISQWGINDKALQDLNISEEDKQRIRSVNLDNTNLAILHTLVYPLRLYIHAFALRRSVDWQAPGEKSTKNYGPHALMPWGYVDLQPNSRGDAAVYEPKRKWFGASTDTTGISLRFPQDGKPASVYHEETALRVKGLNDNKEHILRAKGLTSGGSEPTVSNFCFPQQVEEAVAKLFGAPSVDLVSLPADASPAEQNVEALSTE